MAVLVKSGAVRMDRVRTMVETFKQINIENEVDEPAMITEYYDKFTAALEV